MSDQNPDVMTVAEAAARLRISPSQAYLLVSQGALPGAFRVSEKIIRVDRQAFEAWLAERAGRPNDPRMAVPR